MGLRDRKLEETGENYDIGRACDMWEWVDVFKVLMGAGGGHEGKRPRGGRSRRWEDNIKTDITETGWKNVNWVRPVEYRKKWRAVVNAVMNLWAPPNVRNALPSCGSFAFLRRTLP